MSENITIAIIAALGGGAMGGIVVTFFSFWIDIWRNSIKNKSKKKFIIKGVFSEILDAKNYLEHSLELIGHIREQKTMVKEIKLIQKILENKLIVLVLKGYNNFMIMFTLDLKNSILPVKCIK